jgi:predicted phage-related endonuclease
MSRLDEILALPSITHALVQGSPEWDAFRLQHRGASEAAAATGLSKKVKRNDLLHAKHTGLPREFSEWLRANVLDKGHEVEASARPHVEQKIGDDLYPVTRSRGNLSASCAGLTMDDRIAFEHKQWNEDLAAMVGAGILPDEHMPQCQQVLLVTGAQVLLFVVSDGTPDKMVSVEVTPDREWWERIVAAWDQFDADLAEYELPPAAGALVVAASVQALPAVSVKVEGEITVIDNFPAFEKALRDFLEHRLIRSPKSDQDFADLDVQIKAMKGAEAALESAEVQMLAQIVAVDTAKKAKDMLAKLVRDNRLMAERLLSTEKDRRRAEIVIGGAQALKDHVDNLNRRLGRPYMPPEMAVADFAGAIKGLRSLASMEDAVAVRLANAKIAANETADRIEINLRHLTENASEYKALFPDTSAIVLKKPEDLQSLVTARIAEHRAAEERRAAELAERERARIRAEEQERADREARERQQAEARAAATPAPTVAPTQPTAAAPIASPAVSSQAANVVPMGTRAPTDSGARLRLGEINARLAPITLTADGLATLGFEPVATEKAAKLYRASDLERICAALIKRLMQTGAECQQAA